MGEGKLPVGVLGASGYAGVQLVRLVHQHPRLSLAFVGEEVEGVEVSGEGHGESQGGEPQGGEPQGGEPPTREPRLQGKRFVDVHPHLRPVNLPIESLDLEAIARRCRVVFLALPHGVSHRWVPGLLERGVRVIDLAADYRFADLSVYDSWYGASGAERVGGAGGRGDGAIAARAVYGLPELNRRSLVDAQVVGCPGCYATASLLALAPLLRQGLIDLDNIVIDAKCGTSGEGRSAKLSMLFAEVDNSVVVYGVANHRHTPEIEQVCRDLSGKEVLVQFTPHQIPMVRGLLATVYARLRDPGLVREDLLTIYKAVYQHSPWVTTLGAGIYPQTKWVWGTNHCYLGLEVDRRTGRVIVFSAIDNLMKGQAGQALQCLNVMMGWEETLGLPDLCFYP